VDTKILMVATAGTTATLSSIVYADASTPNGNNPNLFRKSASDLAQSPSGMGSHASEPNNNGIPGNDNQINSGDNNHRSGIGNIGNDLGVTCGSKSPADLAHIHLVSSELSLNPCDTPTLFRNSIYKNNILILNIPIACD